MIAQLTPFVILETAFVFPVLATAIAIRALMVVFVTMLPPLV